MNSFKSSTTRQKIILIIAIVGIAIVLPLATAAIVNYNANKNAQRQLSADYTSIHLPTYLHLESEKYKGTGLIFPSPDDGRAWGYSYTISNGGFSAKKVHDDIVNSLEEAGYTIVQSSKSPSNNLAIFYAQKNTTKLQINLDNPDKVTGVIILAYE